ncbi:MAG: fasciclin domain-containing protein [Gemmatimonadota bacterium]|nr:fasciclin domain-containing protein [Gemmatimonadota bacterium]
MGQNLPEISLVKSNNHNDLRAIGTFRTLVTAIQTANLVRDLDGPGAYTVFAPTDRAFARIPAAELHALMADERRLSELLGIHVVPGRLWAADLRAAGGAGPATIGGRRLDVEVRDGELFVNGARVVQRDVEASNGVVHVLDGVIQ